MTIYVDRFMPMFDRGKWRGGGHLMTTDLGELHAMARRIGLRREWFQDKTFPHYDLTASKHRLALAAGAVPIAVGEFPPDLLMRTRTGTYERYEQRRERHQQR